MNKHLLAIKEFTLRYKMLVVALVMMLVAFFYVFSHSEPGPSNPYFPAPVSGFAQQIGGLGIVEPSSEVVDIGTNIPGIITNIYVTAGQQVKKSLALFTIDPRDINAQLEVAKAKLQSAQVEMQNANHQLLLYNNVTDKRAISNDALSTKRYAAALAQARVKEAQANVDLLTTTLDRLTVKAPIDGTILKVNIHEGEYAPAGNTQNLLVVMGDVNTMNVRVEIDETDVARFNPKLKAIGFMRGDASNPIPLKFVRYEPLIVTKKSFTNGGNEIIDTRTLEIIYTFDNKSVGAFSGQHMDVFIEAMPLKNSAERK